MRNFSFDSELYARLDTRTYTCLGPLFLKVWQFLIFPFIPGAPFNIDMLDVNKFLKRMDGIFLSVYLLEFLLKVVLKILMSF